MKTKVWSTSVFAATVMAFVGFSVAGCGGSQADPNHSSNANADLLKDGTPNGLPSNFKSTPGGADVITLAARYVAVREDDSDNSVPTHDDAQTLMTNVSAVWSQCNVRFILDEYLSPVADGTKLLFNPANQSELDALRAAYDDGTHIVYIATGKWNRKGGDLGNDGSNGWSTVPGMNPQGTVIEARVAKNTLLVSHETGHLFGGLLHVNGSDQLMNHFVTPQTTRLSQSECKDARATVQKYNMAWLR